MVAAGPALHLPKALYLRWIRRDGLVESWKRLSYETILKGRQNELAVLFPLVDEAVANPEDRQALRYAITLYAYRKLAKKCLREGRPLPHTADLHSEAPDLRSSSDLDRLDPDVAKWARTALTKLHRGSALQG
jgi:hypothetical protein